MLYEGVSARPTTIPLAEVRESVSGQPMSAAGPFASVLAANRRLPLYPKNRHRHRLFGMSQRCQ